MGFVKKRFLPALGTF